MSDTSRSLLLGFLVSLIGIVFSLILLEIVVRLFLLKGSTAEGWSDRPAYYYKPLQSETLQDYPYGPKKEDLFRIAVVGDSFTFAPYMQFDDTFPKKLERMLNLNFDTDHPEVEVVNYGIPGLSTSHEIGYARQAVKDGADLVILQITLNDPQIKPYNPTGLTRGNEFGAYSAKEGTLSTLSRYWKTLGFALERIHNTRTHQNYVSYYHDLFTKKRTSEHFKDSLDKFSKLNANREVPVIAVVFPLFGLPIDKNYPFKDLHDKIHTLLSERDIPFLDLTEAFYGIPLSRIQVIPGDDFHPNEIGHRIAAERIYSWLEEQKYIPDEVTLKEKYSTRIDIRPLPEWRIKE